MQIYIHTGTLSVDNGAYAPLSQYFDLAKLLEIHPEPGCHYGFDVLDVPDQHWPLVEELLMDANLLFKVKGVHDTWQNVRTDTVRNHLRPYPRIAH